ncbi:Sodium/calcium exchanger NCL1 [Hondaea fermentalgiana]|uniref:Sodium/calcium exchanger NCL1 n=1 Tax=Hondaea fermentalgiana TaxID=2315210 RepID=A0A2R5GD65_9STRA|nr:Sodium/calcium exchanger NCL1 [Hondaea fermentalgiana]|eukprot:GBG28916.1 Sodium/calcium exchanger NCL1 [Hondaea fermentalgiana]
MGETLSKLFVPLHSLPGLYDLPDQCIEPQAYGISLDPTFGGIVQLMFLGLVYGFVLYQASNMIADGSELLLLLPEVAPIVGSVVIPVLGALPDSAVILFSGLGDIHEAKEQLQVGVGALAGSTIMLLTIPWTLSIVAGRVSISKSSGRCCYAKPANAPASWKKLRGDEKNPWRNTGVEADAQAMRSGARNIGLTAISYLIIQGAAFAYKRGDDPEAGLAAHEKVFAAIGLILCTALFLRYLYKQVRGSKDDKVLQNIVDDKRAYALKSGMLSLQGAFFNTLSSEFGNSQQSGLLESEHRKQRFESVVRKFFRQYDVNGDDSIDAHELQLLLADLHIQHTKENLNNFMNEMDTDGDGKIHFTEFLDSMIKLVKPKGSDAAAQNTSRYGSNGSTVRSDVADDQLDELMEHHVNNSPSAVRRNIESQRGQLARAMSSSAERNGDQEAQSGDGDNADNDEEEEEEVPEDLADLPPEKQRRIIIFRSFRLMITGTVLVLLFSDAMVDVMGQMGKVLGISSFYISFILAPLASNASEFIASYSYALKKTSKTVTISLTSLTGAAIMNNTLCLGVFLALVYFRGLAWEFSAETISILFVESCMIFVAYQRVQTLRMAVFVFSLFPLSLVIVYVLENVFGLD